MRRTFLSLVATAVLLAPLGAAGEPTSTTTAAPPSGGGSVSATAPAGSSNLTSAATNPAAAVTPFTPLPGQAGPADAAATKLTPPAPWAVYGLIGGLGLVTLGFLAFLSVALRGNAWSLSDALSEEVDLPWEEPAGTTVMNNGQVVLKPVMKASTSRLIALMGMFHIMLLFIGFGAFALFYFGTGQGLPPGIDEVIKFLIAGLTLFAPYLVNKFASVFESLAPKK